MKLICAAKLDQKNRLVIPQQYLNVMGILPDSYVTITCNTEYDDPNGDCDAIEIRLMDSYDVKRLKGIV